MSDFKIYSDIPRMMPAPAAPKPEAAARSFGNLLKEAVEHVKDVEKGAPGELQKYLGNESDVHSVMIALDKAELSFQAVMQVRNKIVQAYQEIMKSQV